MQCTDRQQQQEKKQSKGQQEILVLFSFEMVQLAYVPYPDVNTSEHIVVETMANSNGNGNGGTVKVVKNGQRIRRIFDIFNKLGITPICYTPKNPKQTQQILGTLDNNTLQWIFVVMDKTKYPQVGPNYPKIEKIGDKIKIIGYGEGYSACEGKEELRIAVFSAFGSQGMGIDQIKDRCVVFQNNMQEVVRLKEQGFGHIVSQLPDGTGLQALYQQITQLQNTPPPKTDKQFLQFTSSCPPFTFQTCHKLSTFHYLKTKKNITPSLTLTGPNPNIFRLPNSTEICAIVFRNIGDKGLYSGMCEMPSKIGGDLEHERQEDRVLASCVHQTLARFASSMEGQAGGGGLWCLPMFLGHFNIRHALIRSYNKNKGWFLVSPYLKRMRPISEEVGNNQDLINLLKEGKYKEKQVIGIGNLVMLSILMGQSVRKKTFFQTVAMYQGNQPENSQKKLLYCCRTSFNNGQKQPPLKTLEQLELLINAQLHLKFTQLHPKYLKEMTQTLHIITQSFPVIQSNFKSQIWNFDKDTQLRNFMKATIYYGKEFKIFVQTEENTSIERKLGKMELERIDPEMLNYLVARKEEDFDYFTKPPTKKQLQSYGFGLDLRNVYEQQMTSHNNFIIFGQCTPVLSIIKWLKSLHRNTEIIYLSLLVHKPEQYTKQIKLSKSQKKATLFLLDYCQLQQESDPSIPESKLLVNSNWGLKTIFLYRLRMGSCKSLPVVHDMMTMAMGVGKGEDGGLMESNEEVFRTIIQVSGLDQKENEENKFQLYKKVIWLYIRNKWANLGVKAGIADPGQLFQKLKIVVRSIQQKNNRLPSLLKHKALNHNPNIPISPSSITMWQQQTTNSFTSISQQNQTNPISEHLKNIPRAQIILYCLPIYVSSQRILLLHDVGQYLSAYFLWQEIAGGTWQGCLESQQLTNFMHWYPHMPNKQQIKASLLSLLPKFQHQKLQNSQKSSQIMGSNSALNDCLQLLKRIGVQGLFCTLDGLFYTDSPVIGMRRMQFSGGEEWIAVCESGSVYRLGVEDKSGKKGWSLHALWVQSHKQQVKQKSQYRLVGITVDLSQISIQWAQLNPKDGSQLLKSGILTIKSYTIQKDKDMKISQECLKLPNKHLKSGIRQLQTINNNNYMIVLESGEICIGTILINNDQIKQLIMESVFESKGKQLCEESIVKFASMSEGEDSDNTHVGVVIGQATTTGSQVSIYYFTIVAQIGQETGHPKIGAKQSFTLQFPTKIAQLNIAFSPRLQQQPYLTLTLFESITQIFILCPILINRMEKQGNRLKEGKRRRLYRVESDPLGVYQCGRDLWVASRYSFLKRMVIGEDNL